MLTKEKISNEMNYFHCNVSDRGMCGVENGKSLEQYTVSPRPHILFNDPNEFKDLVDSEIQYITLL